MRRGTICLAVWVGLALWASAPLRANIITVQQGGAVPTLGAALSQAINGDTINIIPGPSDYVEGSLVVGLSNLTIQGSGGRPRFTGTRLTLTASGITLRNVAIDGERNTTLTNLVTITAGANQILLENCAIVNPASGTGSGNIGGRTSQNPDTDYDSPGACVRMLEGQGRTVRGCNFECTQDPAIKNENNIISVVVPPATSSDVVIEDCSFQAETKNIMLIGAHVNVLIRNNDFNRTQAGRDVVDRPPLNGFSTGAITIIPTSSALTTVTGQGVRIVGNRINKSAGSGIMLMDGVVNGLEVVDNVWGAVYSPDLSIKSQGDTVVFTGNTFHNTRDPDAGSFVIELDQPVSTANGEQYAFMTLTDNTFTDSPLDYIYVRASITQMTLERNTFLSNLGFCYFQASNLSHARIIDNDFMGGGEEVGTSQASVGLAGAGNVVAGNRFSGNDAAVELYRFSGLTEDAYPGGRNVVSGNVIASMREAGIRERDAAVTGTSRHDRGVYSNSPGNRYYNNTVLICNGVAIDIHSDNTSIYNNLLLQNQGGIRVTTTTQPGVRDFNLVFNNGPGGSGNFMGLATAGVHDIIANPLLVNVAGGDYSLSPSSPARNAGTNPDGPLREPDYVTDIGAFQDAVIDTSVSPRDWELYR